MELSGLVRHLTLEVQRFWFRTVAAGEAVVLRSSAEAWQVDAVREILDGHQHLVLT